jgi:ParB/RepB/Spo0J family partition protein
MVCFTRFFLDKVLFAWYTYSMKEELDYKVFETPIHLIKIEPEFNCREAFTRDSVEELKNSIDQDGLLFPIDIEPTDEKGFKFRLLCGFRRLTSCKLLGWQHIPARIRHNLSPRQASLLNLTENLERCNLNILEEAKALDKIFPDYRTISSIASELKKDTKWVSIRRHLMVMPELVQKAAASGRLSARDLATIRSSGNELAKAKQLLRLRAEGTKRKGHNGSSVRRKSEVKELIAQMLEEGFNPQLARFIGWTIGEVDDEGLEQALSWLRDKQGWLR